MANVNLVYETAQTNKIRKEEAGGMKFIYNRHAPERMAEDNPRISVKSVQLHAHIGDSHAFLRD